MICIYQGFIYIHQRWCTYSTQKNSNKNANMIKPKKHEQNMVYNTALPAPQFMLKKCEGITKRNDKNVSGHCECIELVLGYVCKFQQPQAASQAQVKEEICISTIKKEDSMNFTRRWIELQNIILVEVTQTQEDILKRYILSDKQILAKKYRITLNQNQPKRQGPKQRDGITELPSSQYRCPLRGSASTQRRQRQNLTANHWIEPGDPSGRVRGRTEVAERNGNTL